MERVPRMCLGAVIGAVVGMFVAFKMAHAYWWVGILVGSPIGTLAFSWGDTVALMRAWRAFIKKSEREDAERCVQTFGKETLPTSRWRSAWRKLALAITIFFWWLGWNLVADAAFMYFFPHFNDHIASYLATILPIMACGMWLENRWPDRMSKERAEYLARAFLKSSYPIVLSWHILRALLWIRKRPMRTVELVIITISLPFVALWFGLVACFSRDCLIVGFSAAIGVVAGYFSKSWTAGICTALAIVIVGVVFLANPARRRLEQFKQYS